MQKFNEIVSNKEVPVIMVDQDGLIQDINDAFEAAYGWSRETLKGKMLTTIIPESLRNAHHLGFSRFLTTERASILEQSLDLNIVTREGIEKPARHLITASKENGKWAFAASIHDIS